MNQRDVRERLREITDESMLSVVLLGEQAYLVRQTEKLLKQGSSFFRSALEHIYVDQPEAAARLDL